MLHRLGARCYHSDAIQDKADIADGPIVRPRSSAYVRNQCAFIILSMKRPT